MTLIDRYIFKTVILTALITLLVLLALESFFALLTELDELGERDYGFLAVLQYLLLTLPRRAYQTFPMVLLLGGLLGMGTLAGGSELVAMRAAGWSVLRLVGAALQAGLVLSLLALLLGEFVVPHAEQAAQELRTTARFGYDPTRPGRGFWARDGDNFVHVGGVLPGVRLADIYIYEVGENSELNSVTRAQEARYVDGHWLLEGVSRSAMQPEGVAVDVLATISWDSVISPAMLEVLATDPEDLSMRDLLTYIDYLKKNNLDASVYQLTFWLKAVAPLTNLAMLFIAMPFVFRPQRLGGVGQRLLIGILLGLTFFLVNQLLGNLVLFYGYHPLVGASLPTLAFFAGGAYALSRVR